MAAGRASSAGLVVLLLGAASFARFDGPLLEHDAVAALAAPLRTLTVLDDGVRVSSDPAHPLPPSPWPREVELTALGDETIAFQAILDPGPAPVEGATAEVTPWLDGEAKLDARVTSFAEVFVDVKRPTGNDHDPDDGLAFTAAAALPASGPASFVGPFADPLVPGEPVSVAPGARGAIWVDVDVPSKARAGTYHATLTVRAGTRVIGTRPLVLRVVDKELPYPGAAITTFYEPDTIAKRMGAAPGGPVEASLRQLLHAHHVSAIHEITAAPLSAVDEAALTGALYRPDRGYRGPGVGQGEGVLALGAYGELGQPDAAKVKLVADVARRLHELGVFERTATFVYASDETCDSPKPGAWLEALRVAAVAGVRVGATCDHDPVEQKADLVMSTPEGYDPARAVAARGRGKWTWAYNGRRPFGAPMMLDLPATDLRANAWIAARYDVARWFYWESTFWLDHNRGGRGGPDGFDPFAVAETFHNKDGDHANGDGILVYPGTQRPAGMRDYGRAELFPSVRLKNIRRGAEDAGYITLARLTNPETTARLLAHAVPRALAGTKGQATWSDDAGAWAKARADLLAVIEGQPVEVPPPPAPPSPPKRSCLGCTAAPHDDGRSAMWGLGLAALGALTLNRRRRRAVS